MIKLTDYPIPPITLMEWIDPLPNEIFINVTDQAIPNILDTTYKVSNIGRVYNIRTKHILAPALGTDGYHYYAFMLTSGEYVRRPVHRVELAMFNPHPNMNNLQVNHIDGNKTNNYIENLEWCTRSENITHAYRNNLIAAKSTNKLNQDLAVQACEMLQNGMRVTDVAITLNMPFSTIAGIKDGSTWKRISSNYDFKKRPAKLFTKDQVIKICETISNNPRLDKNKMAYAIDILNILQMPTNFSYQNAVVSIYDRVNYKSISKDYFWE